MSATKMFLDELLEKISLPLHKFLADVPKEYQEDALELWKQNHSAVCECY